MKPNERLYSTWQADSLSEDEYLLSVYKAGEPADKNSLVFIFKINPSTATVFVQGADGNWNECYK